MLKKLILVQLAVFLFVALGTNFVTPRDSFGDTVTKGTREVINKIKAGSRDWPFKKDGSKFKNKEKRLPADGVYREYTVVSRKMAKALKKGKKPNRGKQRVVYDTKNKIFYYTNDHYRTFKKVK